MEAKPSKFKDKNNEHIQVFVRVRPLNTIEIINKSSAVVDATNKDIIVNERPQDRITKTFSFDKVFDTDSKQIDVYKAVVSPLIEEVLAGYNCTVFAYGQTGTGKTFTMEGDRSIDPNVAWDKDPSSGIIPRTLSHLFDELRILQAEYTVRVSFLELYNEELFDLLSSTDDTSKLKLYEDVNKKGSVIVHGLEEVPVHNKNEVYKIMEKGSLKRQTAATLMNAKSSRSHTIFSITVHIKENSVEGEELVKTGKLNLVDLAGSENVGRSGAIDKRAREAGNINQSLLTLGRCIKSLVERTPHIPYRESKLTRLLQDSLGGKTKTSIIATISPAACSLEETLSTLDYAHRAKNITNRPEINQKLTKKTVLKEYTEEIERLRRDLEATREGNGICLAKESYQQMTEQLANQEAEIAEKIGNIRALVEEMEKKEALLAELGISFENQTKELKLTTKVLDKTRNHLKVTKTKLRDTTRDRDEHSHLVEKLVETEKVLGQQAQELLAVAEESSDNTYRLHDKLVRKLTVEDNNIRVSNVFLDGFKEKMLQMVRNVGDFTQQELEGYKNLQTAFDNHLDSGLKSLVDGRNLMASLEVSVDQYAQDAVKRTAAQDHGNNEWRQHFLSARMLHVAASCQNEDEFLNKFRTKLGSLDEEICTVQNVVRDQTSSFPQKLAMHREMIRRFFATQIGCLVDFETTVLELVRKQQADLERSREEVAKLRNINSTFLANLEESSASLLKSSQMWAQDSAQKLDVINGGFSRAVVNGDNISDSVVNSVQQKLVSFESFDSSNEESTNDVRKDFSDLVTESSLHLINAQNKSELLKLDFAEGHRQRCAGFNEEYSRVGEAVGHRLDYLSSEYKSQKELIEETINTVHTSIARAENCLQDQRCEQETFHHSNQDAIAKNKDNMMQWDKTASGDLESCRLEVIKFIKNDLSRDVPTGATPERKDFRYTKILAATSPQESLLERFRATYPSDASDSFTSEASSEGNDSTPENDTLSVEQELEAWNQAKVSGMRRSVSTSDIPTCSEGNELNMSAISEQEYKHENKENSAQNLCLLPKNTKKRKAVLGSLNNVSKSRVDSGLKKPLMAQNQLSK